MEALVDTGASYTWISRDVLHALGVLPDEERVFVLPDGREVRYPMAWVRVRLGERTQPTQVVCGDPGTEPLLGAFTLEGLGLGVDLVNPRLILIPVPGLLKAVAA
ncbi:MAG TPA: aspartyl protease family protein [Gemmatimonadales bacterium]|jgi:predicted aspartyl protease